MGPRCADRPPTVPGKCNITYAKQVKALVDAGTAKSEREAVRKIASETDEPEETVRTRVKRGKKEMGSTEPKPKTEFINKAYKHINDLNKASEKTMEAAKTLVDFVDSEEFEDGYKLLNDRDKKLIGERFAHCYNLTNILDTFDKFFPFGKKLKLEGQGQPAYRISRVGSRSKSDQGIDQGIDRETFNSILQKLDLTPEQQQKLSNIS